MLSFLYVLPQIMIQRIKGYHPLLLKLYFQCSIIRKYCKTERILMIIIIIIIIIITNSIITIYRLLLALYKSMSSSITISMISIIELDDGTILTGKPNQFDGKNPWVSCKFSQLNQSSDTMIKTTSRNPCYNDLSPCLATPR